MLPGGSGLSPSIVAQLGRPGALPFSPTSRVSISEVLGGRLSPVECEGVAHGGGATVDAAPTRFLAHRVIDAKQQPYLG